MAMRVYIVGLGLAFVLGLGLAWEGFAELLLPDALLFFGVLTLVLARLTVPLPLWGTVSLHFVGALALAFSSPPALAALASSLGLPLSRPPDPWREAFNRFQVGLATLVASTLYHLLPHGLGALAAGGTYFLTNLGAVMGLACLTKGLSPGQLWRRNFAPYGLSYLVVSPLAYLLVRLYEVPLLDGWGGFGVLLAVLPLVYLRYMWLLHSRLQEASKRMLQGLVRVLEAKDAYTALHSERVAAIAQDIAREMGLGEVQRELLALGARLHDIGKVGIPDPLLHKGGSLVPEEWDRMRQHPELGVAIVAPMLPYLGPVEGIIRYHHERWDGQGYPEGLRGEEIPLLARILAVADAYEAMTSDRPYRKALSPERALVEIRQGAGSQFDPQVVEAFLRAMEKEPVWSEKEAFYRASLEEER